MMKQFFGTDFADRQIVVKEGETLSTGKHNLTFVMAPMVHWPEVMMTYDTTDKIFFSADAFGKFGALDVEEEWDCEARRYYIGIVGKYGPMVQKLFANVVSLEINAICPLHGPVLTENLGCLLYTSYASGVPIGSYVKTEGILVLGLQQVECQNGKSVCPAACKIKAGDYILTLNGQKITTKQQFIHLLQKNREKEIVLTVKRKNKIIKIKIKPVYSGKNTCYQIGVWIRCV